MAKLFMYAALLVGAVIAGNVQAGSARCEGCTDSQAREKAKQLGIGQQIVSSFSTNKIWIFSVFDRNRGEPGTSPLIAAAPQAVPADIQALFDDARRFYVATNGTLKAAVTVIADDLNLQGLTGGDAFDVVRDANLRARLGDRLATGTLPGWSNLDRAGEQITQGLFGLIGAGDASIEVTILFSDGSRVVYKLSVNSGTGQYLENRARTAGGELIPESNSPGNQGVWYGGGAELAPLVDHMQYFIQAEISYSGTGSSFGSVTCTWIGTTLSCRVHRR